VLETCAKSLHFLKHDADLKQWGGTGGVALHLAVERLSGGVITVVL
jgi:hypothetical protein